MATRKSAKKQTRKKASATARPRPARARARSKGARRPAGSAYEKVFRQVRADFSAAKDAIGKEVEKAIASARDKLKNGSVLSEDSLHRAESSMKERLSEWREKVQDARERVRQAAGEMERDPRYKRASDTALTGLHGLAASLRNLAERVEDSLDEIRPHTTGERVGGGRYDCRGCGRSVILTSTAELPACAGCGGRKFRLAS